VGQSLPGRASSKLGHVHYASKESRGEARRNAEFSEIRKAVCRNQMPSLRGHWICQGEATNTAGSQNLSCTMRAMCGEGPNSFGALLKARVS
jgi:hypothetical protein